MNRLQALELISKKYPYHKNALKLTESEYDTVVEFIEDHAALNHLEFEYAVNRAFLDGPKPKNWVIMSELLVVANTAALGKQR